MSAEPACKITRYECEKQKEDIERLTARANAQDAQNKDHFPSIHPWEDGCEPYEGSPPPRHYIATKGEEGDETICGWMTVQEGTMEGQNYFYLSKIGVIREKHEDYRGVGRRLHETLVKEATEKGDVDFIYLEPVDEEVAETYKKWGYKKVEGPIELFYTIKAPPNEAVRKKLTPPDYGSVRRAFNAVVKIQENKELNKELKKELNELMFQITDMIPLLAENLAKTENKDKREDFLKLLDKFEAKNPEDDQKALITKLTEAVKELKEGKKAPKAGRRKTRRRRRRRARTSRRRNASLGYK